MRAYPCVRICSDVRSVPLAGRLGRRRDRRAPPPGRPAASARPRWPSPGSVVRVRGAAARSRRSTAFPVSTVTTTSPSRTANVTPVCTCSASSSSTDFACRLMWFAARYPPASFKHVRSEFEPTAVLADHAGLFERAEQPVHRRAREPGAQAEGRRRRGSASSRRGTSRIDMARSTDWTDSSGMGQHDCGADHLITVADSGTLISASGLYCPDDGTVKPVGGPVCGAGSTPSNNRHADRRQFRHRRSGRHPGTSRRGCSGLLSDREPIMHNITQELASRNGDSTMRPTSTRSTRRRLVVASVVALALAAAACGSDDDSTAATRRRTRARPLRPTRLARHLPTSDRGRSR